MGTGVMDPERFFSYKKPWGVRMVVKDRDLQVHVPVMEDFQYLYRGASFRPRVPSSIGCLSSSCARGKEVKIAMAEAESSYDSMMQIRQQLRQAYEEFMHLASR